MEPTNLSLTSTASALATSILNSGTSTGFSKWPYAPSSAAGGSGPTAPLPGARGRGAGHALADATLTWAYAHGYQTISVDSGTANPLSRPFWLNVGFHPAGYGVLRLIDSGAPDQPRDVSESAGGN